ncbi:hypothetical protein J6590_077301 [Homalodisca vitripennis]|nr:hypothetical protein J6590_077301 [Homalodisca vitripennis]
MAGRIRASTVLLVTKYWQRFQGMTKLQTGVAYANNCGVEWSLSCSNPCTAEYRSQYVCIRLPTIHDRSEAFSKWQPSRQKKMAAIEKGRETGMSLFLIIIGSCW